jgi:predicted nucleic acid-binding protein
MGSSGMRILIDTDVLLDFALGREPFLANSRRVLSWARDNPGRAAVAWHSLANLTYLAPAGARDFLRDLLAFAAVPTVGSADARRALELPVTDLEDALQAVSALAFGARWIVTRNTRDYRRSPVKALTPVAFARRLVKP